MTAHLLSDVTYGTETILSRFWLGNVLHTCTLCLKKDCPIFSVATWSSVVRF